jgi:hypothetical protein
MLKTAGTVLTDNDLRTVSRCSELFDLGARLHLAPEEQIVKRALEHSIAQSLRKAQLWPEFFPKGVAQAITDLRLYRDYLDGQVIQWQNQAILWHDLLSKILSPAQYFPVLGPTPWRVQVSKTPVDINVVGVLRTAKNQTLHVLYYSPYADTHDRLNDPALPLLLSTMDKLLPQSHARKTNVRAHIVGSDKQGGLYYNNLDSASVTNQMIERASSIVKTLEAGLHWPALPCPWATCPVKHKCSSRSTL